MFIIMSSIELCDIVTRVTRHEWRSHRRVCTVHHPLYIHFQEATKSLSFLTMIDDIDVEQGAYLHAMLLQFFLMILQMIRLGAFPSGCF